MIKYLNVAMEGSLKDKLVKDKGNRSWIEYFDDITKQNKPNENVSMLSPKKTKNHQDNANFEKKTETPLPGAKKEASFENATEVKELKGTQTEGVSPKEQLNNWTKYADGLWTQSMIDVVNYLKFKSKDVFDKECKIKREEMIKNGVTPQQITDVISKVEDLKVLFLTAKGST